MTPDKDRQISAIFHAARELNADKRASFLAEAALAMKGCVKSTTRGGYGAATLSTQVEVGAGERMVDHALIKVYKMLGQLNDLPQGVR